MARRFVVTKLHRLDKFGLARDVEIVDTIFNASFYNRLSQKPIRTGTVKHELGISNSTLNRINRRNINLHTFSSSSNRYFLQFWNIPPCNSPRIFVACCLLVLQVSTNEYLSITKWNQSYCIKIFNDPLPRKACGTENNNIERFRHS